jgi:Xaa-Pro aminopeptidase
LINNTLKDKTEWSTLIRPISQINKTQTIMFKDYIYSQRRERLRRDIGSGIVLLVGNDESPMNYADNTYHFRQDSSFLYFFGISRPGLFAVLDTEKGTDTVYGDDYTVEDFVWRGKQPTIAEEGSFAGVKETGSLKTLVKVLDAALKTGKKIHFLPPYRPENILKLHNLLGMSPNQVPKSASIPLIKAIVSQRNIKSDEEIAEIEKAVNTSMDMHLSAIKMARPGMKECEVAAEMERIALAAGGYISFPVIATINGQTLHNHFHGNTLIDGKLFMLDCGAETNMGYSGDLSSTFPVSKTFTGRQKEIYQIVLDAHMAAVQGLKPGIRFKEIHHIACLTITKGLKEIGFMKGDPEEAVNAGSHALFFPCGTGHMMGLDVHDMEDIGEVYVGYEGEPKSTQFGLKSLRLARELKPGFVLTIEPGIYFISELIDQWEMEGRFREFLNYEKIKTYKDFGGIRNEENYVITKEGARLLGKPKPMTISEIEHLRLMNSTG